MYPTLIAVLERDRDRSKVLRILLSHASNLGAYEDETIRTAKKLTIPAETKLPVIELTGRNGHMSNERIQTYKPTTGCFLGLEYTK